MQSLEQFQVQDYKTSIPAIISPLFCFSDWLLSIQQATTHPQAVSCSCDLVASDNSHSADTARP